MRKAYIRIFDDIGLNYRIVSADGGNIGGDKGMNFILLQTQVKTCLL